MKNRKLTAAYLQLNSGQLHEAVQRSDADKERKCKMIYEEDLNKLCKHTYIEPIYKGINHVKLNFKGEQMTDWITLKQAYIVVSAMLKADHINAILNDF